MQTYLILLLVHMGFPISAQPARHCQPAHHTQCKNLEHVKRRHPSGDGTSRAHVEAVHATAARQFAEDKAAQEVLSQAALREGDMLAMASDELVMFPSGNCMPRVVFNDLGLRYDPFAVSQLSAQWWQQCKIPQPCKRGTYRPLGRYSAASQRKKTQTIFVHDTIHACDVCPAGKTTPSANSVGAARCTDCPRGTFSQLEHEGTYCAHCPAGRDTLHPGAQTEEDCVACRVGRYAQGQGGACKRCQPGTHADQMGMRSCSQCLPGKATNGKKGQTSCRRCAAGKYSNAHGAAFCADCPQSRYSGRETADTSAVCERCPFGYETPYPGATSVNDCRPCPAGTYSNLKAHTGGVVAVCTKCPENTWSDRVGAFNENVCRKCPPSTPFSLAGSQSEAECAWASWYLWEPDDPKATVFQWGCGIAVVIAVLVLFFYQEILVFLRLCCPAKKKKPDSGIRAHNDMSQYIYGQELLDPRLTANIQRHDGKWNEQAPGETGVTWSTDPRYRSEPTLSEALALMESLTRPPPGWGPVVFPEPTPENTKTRRGAYTKKRKPGKNITR